MARIRGGNDETWSKPGGLGARDSTQANLQTRPGPHAAPRAGRHQVALGDEVVHAAPDIGGGGAPPCQPVAHPWPGMTARICQACHGEASDAAKGFLGWLNAARSCKNYRPYTSQCGA